MNKLKRKRFFIKGNFQIAFIVGFILLLLLDVALAGFFIYKLSQDAIENAAFSSHININRSAQLIKPVILRVNLCVMLISVLLAGLAITITCIRLRSLFGKIMLGLENLRDNNTSFRINLSGRKNTRELIKEFNRAASYLEKRRNDLGTTLDSLVAEKELKRIAKLHDKLYSIITNQS